VKQSGPGGHAGPLDDPLELRSQVAASPARFALSAHPHPFVDYVHRAIVGQVEGVVKSDPRTALQLRDDGEGPDEQANDNVWSLQVDVPFQAPAGEFVLEFTAYRSDGLPVEVRNDQGEVVPLTATLPVQIQYPEDREEDRPGAPGQQEDRQGDASQ